MADTKKHSEECDIDLYLTDIAEEAEALREGKKDYEPVPRMLCSDCFDNLQKILAIRGGQLAQAALNEDPEEEEVEEFEGEDAKTPPSPASIAPKK